MHPLQSIIKRTQVTEDYRELVDSLLPYTSDKMDAICIELNIPRDNHSLFQKHKYALIYQTEIELLDSMKYLEDNEQIMDELKIKEIKVVDNVAFTLLSTSQRITSFVSKIQANFQPVPLVVMGFDQKLKNIDGIIKSGSDIYYNINWDYIVHINSRSGNQFHNGETSKGKSNPKQKRLPKVRLPRELLSTDSEEEQQICLSPPMKIVKPNQESIFVMQFFSKVNDVMDSLTTKTSLFKEKLRHLSLYE